MLIKRFIFQNTIDELINISTELAKVGQELNIEQNVLFDINLAVDELVSNIIMYAYQDGMKHLIYLLIEENEKKLKITIIDDGRSFNPLKIPPPDIDAEIQERMVGGLGIHLVKSKVDEITYERIENKNILTFYKNM